ncbi:MAG TPA: hypothetical protein VGP12_03385, partial [Nitrosospira sp.]|nr:hypothetical protein [Nitrosospira sp.]
MRGIVDFAARRKAAGIHLAVSVFVGTLAAILVFGLWYPYPYSLISGGQALFILILSVDLVLGPMLTLIVFNHSKTKSQLTRDIAVVGVLQLAGLAYGLNTVFLARPVAIVFEVNQFRVVSDTDVMHSELPSALPELRKLSLTGPKILAARRAESPDERLKAIDLALQGFDVGTRPSYWQPYSEAVDLVLERARPLAEMHRRYPQHTSDIDQAVLKTGRNLAELKFLP